MVWTKSKRKLVLFCLLVGTWLWNNLSLFMGATEKPALRFLFIVYLWCLLLLHSSSAPMEVPSNTRLFIHTVKSGSLSSAMVRTGRSHGVTCPSPSRMGMDEPDPFHLQESTILENENKTKLKIQFSQGFKSCLQWTRAKSPDSSTKWSTSPGLWWKNHVGGYRTRKEDGKGDARWFVSKRDPKPDTTT